VRTSRRSSSAGTSVGGGRARPRSRRSVARKVNTAGGCNWLYGDNHPGTRCTAGGAANRPTSGTKGRGRQEAAEKERRASGGRSGPETGHARRSGLRGRLICPASTRPGTSVGRCAGFASTGQAWGRPGRPSIFIALPLDRCRKREAAPPRSSAANAAAGIVSGRRACGREVGGDVGLDVSAFELPRRAGPGVSRKRNPAQESDARDPRTPPPPPRDRRRLCASPGAAVSAKRPADLGSSGRSTGKRYVRRASRSKAARHA